MFPLSLIRSQSIREPERKYALHSDLQKPLRFISVKGNIFVDFFFPHHDTSPLYIIYKLSVESKCISIACLYFYKTQGLIHRFSSNFLFMSEVMKTQVVYVSVCG